MKRTIRYSMLCLLLISTHLLLAQGQERIVLWPEQVPGETGPKTAAVRKPDKSGLVTRVWDVTNPLLTVFKPQPSIKNGDAIIVCPGGGYRFLAIDKEGYEVAEWLTSLGYTAFVLEYRVPDKQPEALMDLQRAIRVVRSRAAEWGVESGDLGVIGFSAGGSLAARASTQFNTSAYVSIEDDHLISARPDFALLIYPAYLDLGENRSLTPELSHLDEAPATFLFGTADDRHGNSALVYAGALRDHNIPVELHFLPTGGHGYGLRAGNVAAESWPEFAEKWLERR
ncbi:alpha/beta hydrolase [Lunatimonas salinarum]|uniref:alpha/beta hydrolase n=1 Tax=Lunatimonas salinarum TaxID=1774590 RepID=UPI001ADF71B1|nr:alpha/beta hydrolase [Lunatimonas salinarum]